MAESSSHKSSSPEITPKEEPVTLDKSKRPNPFLPTTQVDFTFDEITFTTNNKVALIYPSHPNQEYFMVVSDFILKCYLKEAFTRALTQYKEYLSEFWYTTKTLEDFKVWVSTLTGGVRGEIGITTFRNALRAQYLSHSTSFICTLSLHQDVMLQQIPQIKLIMEYLFLMITYLHNKINPISAGDGLKTAHTDSGAEAEVASLKARPSYPNINQLTNLLVAEQNIQWELPAEFLDLPTQISSVQEKLKTLDSLPSLLNKVTDTLNMFSTMVENASGATTKDVPSVGQAFALPIEGEKNTKDDDTNLKNELVDLLGIDVVTQYYHKKLLYEKYCEKMMKRRKSSKIINCNVLTKKGPISLKVIYDRWEAVKSLKISMSSD
ncbi:hypothetical protein Tco_0432738 [Tanacetum coccineum]